MPGWILKQATFRGSADYRPRRGAAPGANALAERWAAMTVAAFRSRLALDRSPRAELDRAALSGYARRIVPTR